MFKNNRSTGITLIEFMIGCVLTLILLGILFSIGFSAQKIFQQQQTMLMIQNDINEIKNIFSENIHQAGFIGCAKLTDNFPVKNGSSILLQKANRIAPYGEGFQTWYAADGNVSLYKNMRQSAILIVSTDSPIRVGDVLIISDCQTMDVFVIKKIQTEKHAIKITAKTSLSKLYDTNAAIFLLANNAFYVVDTKDGARGLFWRDQHNQKIELSHRIKKMDVAYDMDAENNMRGVSIHLQIAANFISSFYQNWYFYVALQQS